MAVNTTVEVVMPAMGDSVSEGSILEWHKQEGDEVSEDETLVEISTKGSIATTLRMDHSCALANGRSPVIRIPTPIFLSSIRMS